MSLCELFGIEVCALFGIIGQRFRLNGPMDLHQRGGVSGRESPTTITQAKRTQMPSSATPVSLVVHVSPADTGSARVSVPVVTISPAASGGLT
jgi:hypothetical protein